MIVPSTPTPPNLEPLCPRCQRVPAERKHVFDVDGLDYCFNRFHDVPTSGVFTLDEPLGTDWATLVQTTGLVVTENGEVAAMTPHTHLSNSTPDLSLYERLRLVPPARIIAAEEESPDLLTLGDLRQFAKYLANEFGHKADEAAAYPASWYALMIEFCTPAQGDTVRSMTIELCEEVKLYTGYQQGMLAGGVQRAEALDAYSVACLLVVLLILVPLVFGDYDDGGHRVPAPAHVAQTHGAVRR